MNDVVHFCAHCKRLMEGWWSTSNHAALGGETQVFICDECNQLTHVDDEG